MRTPGGGSAHAARASDRAVFAPSLGGTIPARNLLGRVVHAVGMEIVSGELSPGQALPRESDWGEQLGVSRTVLREATKVLISKGLVESRPRTGTRVRPAEMWNALDPDVLAWQLEVAPRERFVRDLFELRRLVEPAIAFIAAERASPRDIAELERAYGDMEAAGDDGAKFIGPDTRFHHAILAVVDNRMVRALAGVIETALNLSLRLSIASPHGQRHSLPLHGAVLNAIRRRDGEKARQAMARLIDDAEDDVKRALDWPRGRRKAAAKRKVA
jgi:DNA-binding FadR family transcriptional regulator